MNKLFKNALLTLGLTLGGLAAAQTPLAFQSAAHVGGGLSLAVNETWAALNERGYSGTVTKMTGTSVAYRFIQGDEVVEVTLLQTTDGVLIITKDSSAVILAGR